MEYTGGVISNTQTKTQGNADRTVTHLTVCCCAHVTVNGFTCDSITIA